MSESHVGPLLVVGGVTFVIVLLVFAVIRTRGRSSRRSEAIRQWAFRNGFEFIERTMPARELAPMTYLEHAEASNVARSSRAVIMDFRPGRTSDQEGENGPFSAALLSLSKPVPPFTFMSISSADADSFQGSFLEKMMATAKTLAGARGKSVVTVPSRPGFFIYSAEPERAQRLFTEDRIRLLDDKVGWSIEGEGLWLVVSKRVTIPAEEYDEFFHQVETVRDYFSVASQDHFFHSSS